MDKAKKNTVIHAAADRMAANYKSSQIPMYGDAMRMPNRNAVIEIIRDCQKLIFPVYYGDRDLLKLPPEQYSALLMEHIHEKLTRQITLTMPECDENCEVAYAISTAFIERIPAIQELLLKDLSANFEGDPAAYSKEEVLLSYPGMFAIFIYRIAHELYENKVAMIPRMMSEYAHSQTGIDINPGAKIGEYFFIDHGTGIVIGETTVIGDHVKVYQGVTLGALTTRGGQSLRGKKRHPTIEDNVTIYSNASVLGGETVIGEHCTIGPNAMVRDCTVGDFTEINASQTNESAIGSHTTVGPFAYVRPNSTIGDHVKVGDFVEIKNSVIGNGTKISHLTYVGDSDCGERVNFGCGTVTTNYDGFKKYRCTIGDDSFIGCNTNLIAPVKVGEGSYIAAGSTITDEVPADSLAIARERQVNKPGWAEQWRAAHEKK